MCEFCAKHGDGKKWYLQARNYGEEMLDDMRRKRMIEHFFDEWMKPGAKSALSGLTQLDRAPRWLRGFIGGMTTRKMKREHFGQVVPLEEAEEILKIATAVVRVPCVCRRLTVKRDEAYCFGISVNPNRFVGSDLVDPSYLSGPDAAGLQRLTSTEAIELMREFEKESLCHTIWTFVTPFIGGMCNCDRSDCLALTYTLRSPVKVMFRAEYVAAVDHELCVGCRACMRRCQFGAIGFSAADKKCVIDQRACYGCGTCRSACSKEAIQLQDRRAVPAAANLW